MSSAAKIKRLVKPLLRRNSDLQLVGNNTLWLHPIRKFGHHIQFRRKRREYFTLSWHLSALFSPTPWIAPHPGCFDEGIGRSRLESSENLGSSHPPELHRTGSVITATGTGLWKYDDPTLQEDLIFQIEGKLRLMRSLHTLEACIAFLRSYSVERMCQIEHWPMMLDLVAGDLDAAWETWVDVRQRHQRDFPGEPSTFFERIEQRWSELDRPLMEKDRPGLAALLNRWEFENVQAIGVDGLWRPTAFPFEHHA